MVDPLLHNHDEAELAIKVTLPGVQNEVEPFAVILAFAGIETFNFKSSILNWDKVFVFVNLIVRLGTAGIIPVAVT